MLHEENFNSLDGSTRKLSSVITGGVDKLLDRRKRSCLASDLHNYLLAD